jgi:hypothetical protein
MQKTAIKQAANRAIRLSGGGSFLYRKQDVISRKRQLLHVHFLLRLFFDPPKRRSTFIRLKEGRTLHNLRCENIKFYKKNSCYKN